MALTQSEMEAKLAALEERIELLRQTSDILERRSFLRFEQWERWTFDLAESLGRLTGQLDHLRHRLSSRN